MRRRARGSPCRRSRTAGPRGGRPAAATRGRSPTATARACARRSRRPTTGWTRPRAPTASTSSWSAASAPTPSRRSSSPVIPIRAGSRRPAQLAAPLRDRARPRAGLGRLRVAGRQRDRFGFVQRYSWEPWHFGFSGRRPARAGRVVSRDDPGGAATAAAGLGPGAVPRRRWRRRPRRTAWRRRCSPRSCMAESGFNPRAVCPAGAQGIAQFMPATAAAYGLRDPFDAERRDRRPGAPDVGPAAASSARSRSPSPPTTPARARCSACGSLPTPRPRPTSRASSRSPGEPECSGPACPAACGWCASMVVSSETRGRYAGIP